MTPGWRALAIVLAACGGHAAVSRVLEVGAGKPYSAPSAAARVVGDGDTVNIASGTYYDCATWKANGLTITGTGPDTVITDTACGGKAAFVIAGKEITVRGLTFTRIRVADGNGAGIRMEGADLTVEDSQFVNNQDGILVGDGPGTLRIAHCAFSRNGVSLDGRPTHAVLAGHIDLLRIEDSDFDAARGGDHVASQARRTELTGNRLSDAPGMRAPLVSISGGALVLDGNTFALGASEADRPGAVLAYGSSDGIVVRGNRLMEPQGHTPLLRNWAGAEPVEANNAVPPGVAAVSDEGAAYHRLRGRIASLRDGVKAAGGAVLRGLRMIR